MELLNFFNLLLDLIQQKSFLFFQIFLVNNRFS